MKRLFLTLAILSLVALAGYGGWWAFTRFTTPITYNEMEDLQKKGKIEDKEVARLLATFEKNDEDLRVKAAETLAQMGPKAVESVRTRLKHKNPEVRFWAVQTLAFIGPDAAPATDDLLGLLQDNDNNVRYKTVYTLGRLGGKNEKVFKGLLHALADQDDAVQETAVEALKNMGIPPAEIVPVVAQLLTKDLNPTFRGEVLLLLGKAGEPATPTFKELLEKELMKDPVNTDPSQSSNFLPLLHGMDLLGPQVKKLLPELNFLLARVIRTGQNADQELIDLFKKCGPDGAKSMANALQSVHKEQVVHNNRLFLLKAIGEMGPEAKVAVPILIELLKDNSKTKVPVDYRHAILESLGDIGFAAREAIPTIESLTNDPVIAEEARAALRRIGPVAKKE